MEVPEVLGEDPDDFLDNLNIEHFEGGGFSISGVIVAPYCNVIIILMSTVFMVGGILLTVIAFTDNPQVKKENNLLFGIEERKFAGPLIITIGAIMFNIGIFLSYITATASSQQSTNPPKFDPMGSTITEESFFSILPPDPDPSKSPHPFYIQQHSLNENENPKILDPKVDASVQVQDVGSAKAPETPLQLTLFPQNSDKGLLHGLQRYKDSNNLRF